MNKRSIVTNIIWSALDLVVSAAITMLILPYVSKTIGIEAYGYIALCNNIISAINLVASTINVYAVRYISVAYHRGDFNQANIYYSSVLTADVIIALVLLLPATLCIAYMDRILDVPGYLATDVRILFALSLISYIITILGTVFTTATFVKDILYRDAQYQVQGDLLRGALMLVLFAVAYPHVWYVSVATAVRALYILLRHIHITRKYTPEFKLQRQLVRFAAVKELAAKGVWYLVANLGTTLNSGLDLMVTNVFLGATSMGVLSVPKTLSTFVTTLFIAVANSFRPQLLRLYSQEKSKELAEGFLLDMKCCGFVSCTIFSVYCAFGSQFLKLWIPGQDTALIYRLSMLTFLAEVLIGFVQPLHFVSVLTGKLQVPCLSNLAIGFLNLISMVALLSLTDGGLYVVTLTTVVGDIVYHFVIVPAYYTKVLRMPGSSFFTAIIRYLATVSVVTAVLYALFSRVTVTSWLVLIMYLAVGTVLSVAGYSALMLNRSEQKRLLAIVRQKIGRKV